MDDELKKWLRETNAESARIFFMRQLLRRLELIFDMFAPETSGWGAITSFNYLRLLHNVVVATHSPNSRTNAAVNVAGQKLNNDLIVDDLKDELYYCKAVLSTISPKERENGNLRIGLIEQGILPTPSKLSKLSSFALVSADFDIHFLMKNKVASLWNQPLYDGEEPLTILGLLISLEKHPWGNVYWSDWLKGLLRGAPLDWNLQREVALIPDADWEKGPAHIADKIEEIKARFLADKAPLAEKLELNPETGKFFVTPVPARKPDLLNTTLEKTADALDDALNGRNGLLADDRVARVLRRCFEKYNHNPERIEMDFVDAHAGLTRQMASGELADSEEILSLTEVLKNGALDIRANHPDIAANRETRAARALQELTPEQKQQLEDAQPILEALTEGEAHQDMGADIPALINDMIGPVPDYAPPVGPAVRVVNRAAKMSLMMRMKDFDMKLVEKCGYKSLEIFGALGVVIGIGLGIFGLF